MSDELQFEALQPEPKEDPLYSKYSGVLLEDIGLDVLDDILTMGHFGQILTEDKIQIGEYNLAIKILNKCVLGEKSLHQVLAKLALRRS